MIQECDVLFITLQNSFEQWRPVFFVGASVYIVSAIFFIIFGTANIQPWNFPQDDKRDSKGDITRNGDAKDMHETTVKNGDAKDAKVKEIPLTVVAWFKYDVDCIFLYFESIHVRRCVKMIFLLDEGLDWKNVTVPTQNIRIVFC